MKHREKRELGKTEESTSESWDKFKQYNKHTIGDPREENKVGTEKISEELMA